MIYRALPPESATMTALRNAAPEEVLARAADEGDPARERWSHDQMLAAAQLDTLQLILHALYAAHGAKPGAPPPPTPRPGITARRKRKRLTAEERRMLDPRMRQTTPREA